MTATLNVGAAALVGVVIGDSVALNTGSAVGTFADKNVGAGKTVTVSGLTISGASASNYTLIQPTATASITAKNLTVNGVIANDKVYDRTIAATLNFGAAALVGVVIGDSVALNTGSAVGTFADKDVGVGKIVTISGLALSGTDSGNYTLTQPTATASITAKNLTVTGITANDKIYDGNVTATLNVGAAALVGVVIGDSVTLNTGSAVGAFDTPDVGVGKTVTISGLTISGADSGNYTLTQPTATASITAKNLTVTGITANDKIYDGNVTATLNVGAAALVGVNMGDDVTLNTGSAVGTFADKNVGAGKTVTASGFTISGADAGKYTLIQPTATASITAKNLTISGITANDKTYNGNVTATLNVGAAALVGVVIGDSVALNTGSAVGTFSDKNVGAGKTVTVSGLTISGTDSGNYLLTQPTATASITAKSLTVTGITASDKTYDGNTSATLNVSGAALVGVAMGDSVTLNTGSAVGAFDTPDVGVGKTVTISGLTISGADSGNYSLTQPTATATIFASGLTISGITANDKTYNGNVTATLNVGAAALVGVNMGDDVTLNTGSAVGTFADKNVGAGKTVTASGFTISGADAGKYSLNQPVVTASITSKNLTVTGISASDKNYDGTTTATLNFGGAALVGVVIGNSVTLNTGSAVGTFNTPDIGTGKTVTITGLTISGADSGNYILTQPTATASITSVPIVATKFVIVQPANAQINNPINVTVRAEDNSGNLDVTYNNVVTLFTTGSATGGGIVTVTNGVGIIALNDAIAENVTLFLVDSNATGLDVSSTKTVSWTSVPPPPSPSVPTFIPPTPTITARAFPNASISISSFTPGGAFESSRIVSSNAGYFNITLKSGGNTSYGIVATDQNRDTSPAKVFSFNLDLGGLTTDLNIVIAPTIRLLRNILTRGDNLVVSGYSFPNTAVRAFVDGVQRGGTAHTDDSGRYRILLNTAGLAFGSHTVSVNETFSDGISSENSLLRSFTISQVFTPQADFNRDGKVDIQDWSVFLSKWNIPGGPGSDLDLNGDSSIDISDFSIMLRAVQR